jgi:signal transduction histidine kinase
MKGEPIEHFGTVRVRKDRTQLDISLTISPIRDASGEIIGASKIGRDITQRKRMERELRESDDRYRTLADALETQVEFRTHELGRRNSELRDLSGRLLESQDSERRNIARGLHDCVGQILTALLMQLAQIGKTSSKTCRAPKIWPSYWREKYARLPIFCIHLCQMKAVFRQR